MRTVEDMSNAVYEYLAFISYSHVDIAWAKWLQESIEFYKLPTYIYDKHPNLPQQLRPVFRDETDLELGSLSERIHAALSKSKFLIVICSPNSVKSDYVVDEIEFFVKEHGSKNIIPFIVSGIPYSKDGRSECLPLPIRNLVEKPLAANINEYSKDYAMVKVVSYLLGGIAIRKLWDRYRVAQEEEEKRKEKERMHLLRVQSLYVSEIVEDLISEGDSILAQRLAVEILPADINNPNRPYVPEAEKALRDSFDSTSVVLSRGNAAILEAVFGNNETLVAATMMDCSIKIWDRATGQLISSITVGDSPGHISSHVTFSIDGEYILFCDGENLIVSQILTKKTRMIQTSSPLIEAIIPLNDASHVLTVGRSLDVWDIETGTLVKELKKDTISYGWRTATYCNDRDIIVAISISGETICAFSVNNPKTPIWEKKLVYGGDSVAYAIGKDYVVLKESSYVAILDINSGNERLRWKIGIIHYGSNALALSRDGLKVAVANNYDICVFDMRAALLSNNPNDLVVTTLVGHFGEISSLHFGANDGTILSSSHDGTVRIYNNCGHDGKIILDKYNKDSGLFRYSFSFKESKMYVRKEDGAVGLYDYLSREYKPLLSEKGYAQSAVVSNNEKHYVSVDKDDVIHFYNLASKQEERRFRVYDTEQRVIWMDPFKEHSDEQKLTQIRSLSPECVLFSPDDQYLLILTRGNLFQKPRLPQHCIVYRVDDWKELLRIPVNNFLSVPAFSNDSATVYTVNENHLWGFSLTSGKGKQICEIKESITHILCHPNSNLLICASGQSISAYNSATGDLVYRVNPLGDRPLIFSSISDDYCLYSLSTGIRIFRSDSGTVIRDIPIQEGTSLWNAYYSCSHESIIAVLTDLTDDDVFNSCGYVKEYSFPKLSSLIRAVRGAYKNLPLTDIEKKKYYLE